METNILASITTRVSMISLLSLALAACEPRHDHDADHHEEHTGSVTLNNGEKWEADQHTLSAVEQMKIELSDFEKARGENYDALADSLTYQLDILVAGCTMTGPAHDQLHMWLVPLMERVKDLSHATGIPDSRAEVREIRKTLDSFDDFFEQK